MLVKAARWTSKEYLKSAYTEAEASESQNFLVQQIDRSNFQPSLVPKPCLSPPGRSSEPSQNAPDPIIKAKDPPAQQVPASVNKASLKEISEEKLRPISGVAVSGSTLVYICGHPSCYVLFHSTLHTFSAVSIFHHLGDQ